MSTQPIRRTPVLAIVILTVPACNGDSATQPEGNVAPPARPVEVSATAVSATAIEVS